MLKKALRNTGADRAESKDSNSDLFHFLYSPRFKKFGV
jgi:hypothetical protein